MHNRIVTLFDLDELLGAATARPRAALRKPGVKPASPAGAKPGSKKVKAQAFDHGAPITIRYGDAHARSVSRPAPPAAGKVRTRSQPHFVGAFDDEDADSAQVAELEETEEDELAGLEIGEEDSALLADTEEEEEETETEDSTAQSRRALPQRRRPVPSSPSLAQQVAAFEQEIQDLAAKRPPESPPAGAPVGDTPSSDDSSQARPPQAGGHRVFDQMAQGMEFSSEFRLPPVEVKRLFRDLDQQIDKQTERERSRAAAAEPVTVPTVVAPALALPDDAVLAGDLAHLNPPTVDPEQAAQVMAEQLGTGKLLHFTSDELELDDEETLAVLAFFWPEMDFSTLGAVTKQDRGFAQALLIEAADASHSMAIVDTIFRYLYKPPKSFASIRNALLKVAKKAVEDQWFKKIKTPAEAEKVQIYDSVRTTVARNFRTVLLLRRTTGELTGY